MSDGWEFESLRGHFNFKDIAAFESPRRGLCQMVGSSNLSGGILILRTLLPSNPHGGDFVRWLGVRFRYTRSRSIDLLNTVYT